MNNMNTNCTSFNGVTMLYAQRGQFNIHVDDVVEYSRHITQQQQTPTTTTSTHPSNNRH